MGHKELTKLAGGIRTRGIRNFLADLGHICEASDCGAVIDVGRVPLSPDLAILFSKEAAQAYALGGGDDYELLFTAPSEAADGISAAARQFGVPVTAIGHIDIGRGVKVIGPEGYAIKLMSTGFRHF